MPLEITEEIIARQSPEAQAIIRFLLAGIASLQAENAELKTRIEELERRTSAWPITLISPRSSTWPTPPTLRRR